MCLNLMKLKQLFDSTRIELKKITKIADQVEGFADEMTALTDEELQAKTPYFKQLLTEGKTLDDILPEAFAVVREAARRVLGLYPYYVQILGAITLHNGNVTEMRTGEGKSLTGTMPAYLNALGGKGVYVVTVNEYLSERDGQEMGELYNWLGLSVGINLSKMTPNEKREAYASDITYTTNSEMGFDYLRDNMTYTVDERVQRGLNYAIVDEVDSILIDEARTPLVISNPSTPAGYKYERIDKLVKRLKADEDYILDIPTNTVALTTDGIDKLEGYLSLDNLYDAENSDLIHFIDTSLRANVALHKDIDYVVKDGKVELVDQFTGRVLEGRRYSDGLHQAIEAKEGVEIQKETKTMANITYQNLFRLFNKLSGMTGTAKTEEEEFREIYNMLVVEIPTNKPIVREDLDDLVYISKKTKFNAVVNDIKFLHEKGQPILVGTVSVDDNEYLSSLLTEQGIPHELLNAKNHHREADIIRNAGQKGSITIATNMAGRGTDIKLGPGVKELGGLFVIGTERHESRRIDNQLRGRAGRQGDVGSSQFHISLEDDLLKRFGSDKVKALFDNMSISDDEMIIRSKFMTKQVESAQKRVEGNNYDARKSVLEYDDVMNDQRIIMYGQRNEVMEVEDNDRMVEIVRQMVDRSIHRQLQNLVEQHASKEAELDVASILETSHTHGWIENVEAFTKEFPDLTKETITQTIHENAMNRFDKYRSKANAENAMRYERSIILNTVDMHWTNHIDGMTNLKMSVQFQGYAQNDPKLVYQQTAIDQYHMMIADIEDDVTKLVMNNRVYMHREEAEEVPTISPFDMEERVAIKS